MTTLLLIDGHSLAHRSYHAFAKGRDGGLRTSTGIPTNICFGFLKSLWQVMETHTPDLMAIAFDLPEPTFRHQIYPQYKAKRTEIPADFHPDLENLQQLLTAFNLHQVTVPGYEADDILATLARQGAAAGYQVKIVTGDRDLFQLINDSQQISVLYFEKISLKAMGVIEYKTKDVEAKLGIKPEQVVDYKALCGDPSDNIPGVPGIGAKTAVTLLTAYQSLQGIYENLKEIKGANLKKLTTGKQQAQDSQFLAQIKTDVPLATDLQSLALTGFDPQQVTPLLESLELKQFSKQLDKIQQYFKGEVVNIEPDLSEDTWFFSREDTENDRQKSQIKSIIEPKIIDTEAALNDLISHLQQQTDPHFPVAWDTETTALEPKDAQLVGLACCWGENPTDVAYIPLNHRQGKQLQQEQVLERLRPILEGENYPKSFQNTKFDRRILHQQGITLTGVVFDTLLASYVLNPEQSHNLTDLSRTYLTGIVPRHYQDLKIPKGENIASLNIATVANYCGLDAYATFCLVPKLRAELAKTPELEKLLLEVEQPLEPVLAAMEEQGIRIDRQYLAKLSKELEKDLIALEQKAYKEAGKEFKLTSPKDLSELLFETLQLNRKKSRKIKTGYSTDHATLEKLQGEHPIIDLILEHRTLFKLQSTYIKAIPALVHPQTQRVHTDFNQVFTNTGRLSSSNPNLQNIPIRTEFSRQIREAFLPREGWLLVTADYSQIELRILAHLSQEPVLVEAYRQGEDVHTVTARLLFDKEEVTADDRRIGKIINFGVIYGMGSARLAREVGVPLTEAREFIDRYRERYAKVFAYLEQMKREAIANGYVTTILGRRRYFNFAGASLQKRKGQNPEAIDLKSLPNLSQDDAQLLRGAANAPIQGSSADIIKIAMVKLSSILQKYQAQLLLQVHDELVLEVPPQEWSELQPQIKETMEKAIELSIPLVVEVRAGKNWREAKY